MLNRKLERFRLCLSARQKLSQPVTSARSHSRRTFSSATDPATRQRLRTSAEPTCKMQMLNKKLGARLRRADKATLVRFCTSDSHSCQGALFYLFFFFFLTPPSPTSVTTPRLLCVMPRLKDSSVKVQTSCHNKQFDTLGLAEKNMLELFIWGQDPRWTLQVKYAAFLHESIQKKPTIFKNVLLVYGSVSAVFEPRGDGKLEDLKNCGKFKTLTPFKLLRM